MLDILLLNMPQGLLLRSEGHQSLSCGLQGPEQSPLPPQRRFPLLPTAPAPTLHVEKLPTFQPIIIRQTCMVQLWHVWPCAGSCGSARTRRHGPCPQGATSQIGAQYRGTPIQGSPADRARWGRGGPGSHPLAPGWRRGCSHPTFTQTLSHTHAPLHTHPYTYARMHTLCNTLL